MEHEDYIKKRNRILKDYASAIVAIDLKLLDNPDYKFKKPHDKAEAEAAQAIDALVLEVIGEDAMYKTITGNELNMSPKSVQELRYEQRRTVQGDKS